MPRFWYLPARREGGRRPHRRRPRPRRHRRRPLERFEAAEPGRLLGRRLAVRALHLVHVSRTRGGPPPRRRTTSARASRSRCTSRPACAGLHPVTSLDRATSTTSSRSSALTCAGGAAARHGRTHCIVWSDWDGQPKAEAAHGIRLDTNYYYWPGSWVGQAGPHDGLGLPAALRALNGSLIDVYQAMTQLNDELRQQDRP